MGRGYSYNFGEIGTVKVGHLLGAAAQALLNAWHRYFHLWQWIGTEFGKREV